jgi:Ferritin-like domain
MNRRYFLASTAAVTATALGGPWLGAASAASDDELAFANFGVSTEFLLKDFHTKALAAKVFSPPQAKVLRRGRSAAAQHAKALSDLLVGAGQAAPAEEDFAFEWPEKTFSSASNIVDTGLVVLRALLGSYQTAAASVSVPDYRVLYASLAASLGQQVGALSAMSRTAGAEPFPVAIDLETASAALEAYLG